MSLFNEIDLGGLQRILFPVVEALGGPDVSEFIEEKGVIFQEAADVLDAAAGILRLAGEATEDGIIDNEEINAIVAAAPTIETAVAQLFDAITGAQEGEVE